MARTKNATKPSEDLIQLWSALEHIESAALYFHAAHASFGEDGRKRPNLESASSVVAAGKQCIAKGLDHLLSIDHGTEADQVATTIVSEIYNTFDLAVLVCAALKSGQLPDGEGMTICPVAGSLSVITKRVEVHAQAIRLLARDIENRGATQQRRKAA